MAPKFKRLLIIALALACVLALSACALLGGTEDKKTTTEKGNEHEHEHTPIIDKAVEPTCTEPGKTEGSHCFDCGEVIVAQQEIPAKGHTLGEWTVDKEASCTEEGKKHAECTSCHETVTESIPLAEHTESDWILDRTPTCSEEGANHTECTVCHETLRTETIDKEEHTESDWIIDNNATEEANGSKHIECTVCHTTIKTETIPATASLGLKFTLSDDGETYSVTGIGTCRDTELVIPSTYNGKPVTSIGWNAFSGCTSLTEITIPDAVTIIYGYAFSGCTSLTSVTIPDSVTSIGDYAFYNCTLLETVYWNAKLCTEAGSWSDPIFENCKSLKSVIIGNNVTTIPAYAFYYCTSLTNVTIPDNVTSIGNGAFGYCSSLTNITIPDSVTVIGSDAFNNCKSMTSVTIPNSVTSIGEQAFSHCISLTSVTIPNSVTSIGGYAFSDCTSLTNVTIPDSVTSISGGAFNECTSLTSVTIPDSVTSIGYRAFAWCTSLTSLTIPNSITSIGDEAFCGCNYLYKIVNKSSFELTFGSSDNGYIAKYAKIIEEANGNKAYKTESDSTIYIENDDNFLFKVKNGQYTIIAYFGNKTDITLPDNINGNGYEIYNFKGGINVTIPDGVTTIGQYAFSGCTSLMSVTIPDSVPSIGEFAFSGCRLLETVYWNATACVTAGSRFNHIFDSCTSLKSVIIGDNVTTIPSYAFYGCTSLKDVYYLGTIEDWCNIDFCGDGSNPCYNGANLYINGELLIDLVVPDTVTSIKNHAFYGCTSLTSVTVPDSVTSIGGSAFKGCTSLKFNEYGNAYYLGNESNPYFALIKVKDKEMTTCIIHPDIKIIVGNAFGNSTSLTKIHYTGTKAQWESISKGSDWNYNTGSYKIYCTDGEISK